MTKKFFMVLGMSLLVLLMVTAIGCGETADDAGEPEEEPAEETEETTEEPAETGEVITLEAVSYWSAHLKDNIPLHYFVDKVNEELGDRVEIVMLGGPEVVSVPDQAEALNTGVIDFLYFPADFYIPYVPEIDALKLSKVSPLEMHENGAHEFFDQLMQEKGNAKYFGQMNVGPEWFGIYTDTKIESIDDFNGMIFRTIPAYEAFLQKLGIECTRLSWEELLTAMDRGTIDGFAHSISGGFDIGVHEAADYLVKPFFYYGAASLLMNLDAWNSIPDDIKPEIERIAYEAQEYGFEWAAEEYNRSIEGMIGAGLEIIELPPEDAEQFLVTAEEAGWEEIAARSPENVDRIRELLTK
ncbi:MAG: TRAP transporter substrate-binding protein DctP [Bacillota bacterium]|nr:TRAP transporter substrate-binding protein DctP [Bacillota bacterium]